MLIPSSFHSARTKKECQCTYPLSLENLMKPNANGAKASSDGFSSCPSFSFAFPTCMDSNLKVIIHLNVLTNLSMTSLMLLICMASLTHMDSYAFIPPPWPHQMASFDVLPFPLLFPPAWIQISRCPSQCFD